VTSKDEGNADETAAELLSLCLREDHRGRRVYGARDIDQALPLLHWQLNLCNESVPIGADLRQVLGSKMADEEVGPDGFVHVTAAEFDLLVASYYHRRLSKLSPLVHELAERVGVLSGVDLSPLLGRAARTYAFEGPAPEGSVRGAGVFALRSRAT